MANGTKRLHLRIAIGGVIMMAALLFWILGHDALAQYVGVTR